MADLAPDRDLSPENYLGSDGLEWRRYAVCAPTVRPDGYFAPKCNPLTFVVRFESANYLGFSAQNEKISGLWIFQGPWAPASLPTLDGTSQMGWGGGGGWDGETGWERLST